MKKNHGWMLLGVLGLLCLASSPGRAADTTSADPQTTYEAALAALAQGDAETATETLEGLIVREGYAPGALVALGDAYLAKGEAGRAIVAYERALRARPEDPASVRERLAEAYERAGEQPPSASLPEVFAAALPAEAWLGLGGVAALLLLLAALGVGLRWRHRGAFVVVGAVSAFVLMGVAAALHLQVEDGARAIVTTSADALVSPIDRAEVVLTTHPGRPIEPLARRGDRVQVRFRSGMVGWVPADSVATVDPRAMDALPTL